MKGVDANVDLSAHAGCLASHGYGWAARYFKHTDSCLTKSEAAALSAAGLFVVSIVEAGYPTSAEYFSEAKGRADGEFARTKAAAVGQPAGSPIYLAVDYDASAADVAGPIAEYFRGVAEAFQAAGDPYPIGVYGSGLVCGELLLQTSVTFCWLAMSRGWRRTKSFSGWNIRQTVGAQVCGISVDENETQGHGGGWRIEGGV